MASNHGHSTAAWTGVSIMLLGAVVGGLAFVVAQWWLLIVGVALFVGGAIAGLVMNSMGLDSPRTPSHDLAELRERFDTSSS